MKRRTFLKSAAVWSAAASVVPLDAIAQQKQQHFKIGMAATAWLAREHSSGAYWKAAAAIAALGIGATEADNGDAQLDVEYGKNPQSFRELSLRSGVRLTGVYQALLLHERALYSSLQAQVRSDAHFLQAIGAEYIALGWDPPPVVAGKAYQRTPQDLRQAVSAANELGKIALDEFGIYVAFHAERDISKEMILQFLDDTDPRYVRLCADVGHLTAAGLDAVEVVKQYASRLAVSHWKDFDPRLPGPSYLGDGAKGDFVEVGQGTVNFVELSKLYRRIGFSGWVMVELDQTRKSSILVSAQEMKTYVISKLGLGFYDRAKA